MAGEGPRQRLKEYRAGVRRRIQDLKWDVLALYLARRDPRVPFRAKLAIALAVGYFVSPIDLIPDFIPVIGQLDELVIVTALTAYAIRCVPPEALDEYRARAKIEFGAGRPKAYLLAIVLAAVWVLVTAGFFYLLWRLF